MKTKLLSESGFTLSSLPSSEVEDSKCIITPDENETIKQVFVYNAENIRVNFDRADRLHVTVKD